MTRRLVIAGTHSGVGKTTVALGLMAALRRRGLVVQPFKVGPDFIDPGHHTAVCGRAARNLDTWMLSEETVRATFARAADDADVAIIEGVMGLFDGAAPAPLPEEAAGPWREAAGSTADVARLLAAPVVLVVDASAMAGSVAAVVKGFADFAPEVRLAGVLCNRVAGPGHYDYLEAAIRRHTPVRPLGWLPRRHDWKVPERHLGLVTAGEFVSPAEPIAQCLAETVDLDALLNLASVELPRADPKTSGEDRACGGPPGPATTAPAIRAAVARDAAFCFYYPENLELLEAAGAQIVPFSPLADETLPDDTSLLYLGGGYPEVHAARLAANESMRRSIRRFHEQGGTIYAECGGLMYAGRELLLQDGTPFPMLDLLPVRTRMQARLAALGYVHWRTTADTPLGPAGTTARGHEFHYSSREALAPLRHGVELRDTRGQTRPDGLISGNLLAGYAHLHFGSQPRLATELVRFAAASA